MPEGGRTALIVEDEAIIAIDLVELIAALGFTIAGPVARGEDAVLLAERVRPQLLVVDVNLAGELDGIETARRIQATGSTPVLVIAGHPRARARDRVASLHPMRYLEKPFEAELLQEAVRSLVSGLP